MEDGYATPGDRVRKAYDYNLFDEESGNAAADSSKDDGTNLAAPTVWYPKDNIDNTTHPNNCFTYCKSYAFRDAKSSRYTGENCMFEDWIDCIFRYLLVDQDFPTSKKAAAVCPAFARAYQTVCAPPSKRRKEDDFAQSAESRYLSDIRDVTWDDCCCSNPIIANIVVEWLFDVVKHYKLSTETFQLTVEYLYTCLKTHEVIVKTNIQELIQLTALACLFIAAKFHETDPPLASELVDITENRYTVNQIIMEEGYVLNFCLKFRLCRITRHSTAWRLLGSLDSKWGPSDPSKIVHNAEKIGLIVDYLCNMSLIACTRFFNGKSVYGNVDFCLPDVNASPSLIASAIVFFALTFFEIDWTFELSSVSGYSRDDIEVYSRCIYRLYVLCRSLKHCEISICESIGKSQPCIGNIENISKRYNENFYNKYEWLVPSENVTASVWSGVWIAKKDLPAKQTHRIMTASRSILPAKLYKYENGYWTSTPRTWYNHKGGIWARALKSTVRSGRIDKDSPRSVITLVSDIPTYPDTRMVLEHVIGASVCVSFGRSKRTISET